VKSSGSCITEAANLAPSAKLCPSRSLTTKSGRATSRQGWTRASSSHLELAGPQTSARAYAPAALPEDIQSLQAALEPPVAALCALGWHVETAERCVSVHRHFKNRKSRKGADVAIMFNEFLINAWDDGKGRREEGVKSKRP
jgi:hypothetical protein